METRTYSRREIVQICRDRGFTPMQEYYFLNTHNNMTYGYTIEMVDQFEYSINGPVMLRNHPDMYDRL